MTRFFQLAVVATILLSAGAEARGPRRRGPWIVGRVLAATQRYVFFDLGQRHGLKRGDEVQVRIDGRWENAYRLERVGPSRARAVLEPGARIPAKKARARARWRSPVAGSVPAKRKPLPPPRDPAQLAAAWRGVDKRPPKLVEYTSRKTKARGKRARDGAQRMEIHGALGAAYAGWLDLADSTPQASVHQLDLFSALDARGLLFGRLDYSHRIGLRYPFGPDIDQRPFPNSRPKLRVQRMMLALRLPRTRITLGRFTAAPTPDVSSIDGGAARVRLGRGLYLGAFGGLAPGLDDLGFQTDATRFGVYGSLRLANKGRRRWSLAADIGALGTTFAEELDRKALSGQMAFTYGSLQIDASFVLDLYGADHPSELEGADLSLLSARLAARPLRRVAFVAAFDHYRLVPSRELLALGLPREVPVDSARLNLDFLLAKKTTLSLDGGLSYQGEASWIAWAQLGAASSHLLSESDVLRATLQSSRGNIFDSLGGRLSYGLELLDGLDAALAYGLYADHYRGPDTTSLRHSASMTMDLVMGRRLLVTLDSTVQLSDEERVLYVIASSTLSF